MNPKDSMKAQELSSLEKYVSEACPEVNQNLRKGGTEIEGLFDGLFEVGKTPEKLYRFIPNQYIEISIEGHYSDKAYLSCTKDTSYVISHFTTDNLAFLIINLPLMTKRIVVKELLPNHNDEGEYILPRGLVLLVDNESTKYETDTELRCFIEKYNCSSSVKELRALNVKCITCYNCKLE